MTWDAERRSWCSTDSAPATPLTPASSATRGLTRSGNTPPQAVDGLEAPNLQGLGLGNVEGIEDIAPSRNSRASHGLMVERSAAKATLAGHWEMMGLVLDDPLPTYPEGFPKEILLRFERETGRGVIGNRPASGTEIIEELGPEQERTGAWILYTSADSVFQVAAHTDVIPLEELYEACKKAHGMLIGEGEIMVERVIARPFHGRGRLRAREREPPRLRHHPAVRDVPGPGRQSRPRVVAVGKIRDIFDGRGITEHLPAPPDDAAKVDAILQALGRLESGLIFANLVDFDAKYGHRRDPEGMARNIKRFDDRLPELLDAITEEDLLIITADHGNDPTFTGTDHTRERVPLLVVGTGPRDLASAKASPTSEPQWRRGSTSKRRASGKEPSLRVLPETPSLQE